jgi:ABC-type dipeptide/oligopeptide/nickel transport system ATPase component/ABC-type dipeptide/oligopeptide/nickel transport system permease subunit
MSQQLLNAPPADTAAVVRQPLRATAKRRIPGPLLGGLIGMGIIILVAIIAPILWGTSADQSSGPIRGGASAAHWLGTDSQGRDVLQRTLVATRLTLIMAVIATALAVVLGGLLGTIVIIVGPRLRWVGTRAIDLFVSLPPIIVALAITAVFRPGTVSVVIAIGIAFSPQFARLTNTLASSVGQKDFVVTARLLGLRGSSVLVRHILPNIAAPVLVLTSVCLSTTIVTMSGLSFVGLGVQPPSADWGQLLASGIRSLYENPIEALGPSLAILLTGLAAGLIGDGLAQYGEPRQGGHRAKRVAPVAAAVDEAPVVTDGIAPVVSMKNLRVYSGHAEDSQAIVKGISLDIRPGEIVGLVGESGSGKSLTAMTVAQLTPPELRWTADRLQVAGHTLAEGTTPPTAMALDVGIVFQDPSSCFNPARRLGPQLTEAIRVHKKIGRREANAMAVQRLREAKVSQPERRLHQYPHELSGGMRQRAMIAMALLTGPSLLIADEPTTALDVTVQADVLRVLKQINIDHDMAVLLISHDITVVSAMCDRVCVMYAGEIVEEVTVEALRRGDVHHPHTKALLAASPRSLEKTAAKA